MDQPERVAADPAARRIRDREDRVGRDRGIDRVAAAPEDVYPRGGGQRMRGGDHRARRAGDGARGPGHGARRDHGVLGGGGRGGNRSPCGGMGHAVSPRQMDDRADGPRKIMLIRHGEKPPGDGSPTGVHEDGSQNDHSLIVRGWQRAGALVPYFAAPNDAAIDPPTYLYAP